MIPSVIKKIFPPGSEVTKNSLEVPLSERFYLISGNDEPRWLIPQNRKFGSLIFRHWKPYNFVSRIKWRTICTAFYLGQLDFLPGVQSIGIAGSSGKEWHHIGWAKESFPKAIVYFGTPSRTRKAVAILVDQENIKPQIIVKVPVSNHAAEYIKREYNILHHLYHLNRRVAPKPLLINIKEGVASQEAIIGSPTGKRFTIRHLRFLDELNFFKKTTNVSEHSQRLLYRLSKTPEIRSTTRYLLNRLLEDSDDATEIPNAFTHGDFAPWNILKGINGSLIALDWETGDYDGLPLYDFFFFFYQQSYLFNKKISRNEIQKLSPVHFEKIPFDQIKKFTVASLGFRIAKEIHNMKYLNSFLKNQN